MITVYSILNFSWCMKMIIRNKTSLLGTFFLGVILLLSSSVVLAQDIEDSERPQNSHKSRYGDRWECNRGYREENDTCAKIMVPDNAFLDRHGKNWVCDRGFSKKGSRCQKITLPQNS